MAGGFLFALPTLVIKHPCLLFSRPAAFLPPDTFPLLSARVGFPPGPGFESVAHRLAGAKAIERL